MEYERFGITRAETIIVDEFIEMTWTPNNKRHYESLGYKYTKTKEKFMVRPRDLSPTSKAIIEVQCPICKQCRHQKYADINKTGHSLCAGCACIREMSGIRLGRLIFTDINWDRSGNGVIWWNYICDCGTIGTTRRSNVIAENATVSCGCYHRERVRAQCGENHYNWNPDLTDEERIAGRHSQEDKQWRRDVYERDNYTCQVCGDKTGGNFEAHHLHSYKHHPDKRLDVNNGITICKHEHAEFHSWMGGTSADCTPEDFERWKIERGK